MLEPQADALDAPAVLPPTSVKQAQALTACIDELCTGLHVQAGLLQRCLDLHPCPPSTFPDHVQRVVSRLNDAIDASCEELANEARKQWGLSKSFREQTSSSHGKGPGCPISQPRGERRSEGLEPLGSDAHSRLVDLEDSDPFRSNLSSNAPEGANGELSNGRRSSESSGRRSTQSSEEPSIGNKSGVQVGETSIKRESETGGVCSSTTSPASFHRSDADGQNDEPGAQTEDTPGGTLSTTSRSRNVLSSIVGKSGGAVLPKWRRGSQIGRHLGEGEGEENKIAARPKRMSLSEQMQLGTKDEYDEKFGACIEGVMNPNWPGRLGWDLAVIVVVLVDAMILPFQMSFEEGIESNFVLMWLWLTTAFFGVDMLVSMFTGYTAGKDEPNVPPGKLVTDKRRILRNYLRTWFPVDFASTIPWGKISDSLSSGGSDRSTSAQMAKLTKIVKFVRFLRLMRMLRLAKLAAIWERVEASMGNLILKQSVSLFRILLVLLGICHWNACIWWLIGQPKSMFTEMTLSEEGMAFWESQKHWTTELQLEYVLHNGKAVETNWTWLERDMWEQYIFCCYWTLGVMRTMPAEVQPVNKVERIYVMVFMFFAFSAFAICVALITQTYFKFSERKRMFDEDMAAVRFYMRQVNATENVQKSVKAFLKHLFERRKILAKEHSMLSNLPSSLSSMLKHARLVPFLKELPVLQEMPEKAALHVSDLAEVLDLAPGTCICRKGRTIEAAFVVMSGRLSHRGVREEGEDIEDFLSERLFRGKVVDEECLSDATPMVSQRTLVAAVCTEVIRIDRHRFFGLMLQHEEFKHSFTHVSDDYDMVQARLPEGVGRISQGNRASDYSRQAHVASTAAMMS